MKIGANYDGCLMRNDSDIRCLGLNIINVHLYYVQKISMEFCRSKWSGRGGKFDHLADVMNHIQLQID